MQYLINFHRFLMPLNTVQVVSTHSMIMFLYAGARSFVPQTGNTRRMLAARPSLWPQHWTFLSAVTADAPLTSAHVVIRSASSGPRAVVLGDSVGRLYIFSPDGLLLHEYDAGVCRGGVYDCCCCCCL